MISEHLAFLNLVFLCVAYDIEEQTVDTASMVTSLIDEPDSPSPSSPTKSVDELLQVIGMFKKLIQFVELCKNTPTEVLGGGGEIKSSSSLNV